MKNVKSWIGVFLLSVFTTLGSIGFGSWFVRNEKTKQYIKEPDSTAQKVAYTQNDGTNTYYTTLYAAINNTKSGTIYVIPGTNPTLDKSASIASGVTLSLPYLDDLKNNHAVEDEGRTSTGDFADYVEYSTKGTDKPTIFCQSNVTIADGVTLTNNGTIVVGGVLGRNGQTPTGMTVGNYSKITMGSGSVIDNRGVFTCYGYVKDATGSSGGLIYNYSGSSYSAKTPKGRLTLPFVIYDFRGGSYSSYSVLRAGSMPFSVFDFPNIQSRVSFSGSASLEGTITIYTSSVVTSHATVIGPSDSGSLIRYSAGSSIEYKCNAPKGYTYDDYQQNTKEGDVNKTTFRVSGDVQIANLSLNVGIEINTEKYNLPFSYKFDFAFESGEVSISNKVKFLAGSNVTVGENATVSVNAETSFYRNYIPVITTGTGDKYPRYIKSARLINNGKLNLNSSFGGVVESSTEGARIFTQGGYSGSITTTEALSGRAGGLIGDKEDHTENAKITKISQRKFVSDSETLMSYVSPETLNEDALEKNKQYVSASFGERQKMGWVTDEITNVYGIRYVLNNDSSSNPNSDKDSFVENGNDVQLEVLSSSDKSFVFNGFFYDADYSDELGRDSTGKYIVEPAKAVTYLKGLNHVKIYAKWVEKLLKQLSIVYSYRDSTTLQYVDSSSVSVTVNNDTLYTLSAPDEAITFEKIVKEGVSKRKYELIGWHLEIGKQKSSTFSNGTTLSWNDIETYGSNGTLRIVADYQETGYLRMTINNASWKFWGNTTYVIQAVKVNDSDAMSQNDIYICATDKIYIETYNRLTGTSRCDVKINNETVLNVSKTNKTFTFNDYSSTLHYFDEGQYGIVLQGNS